MYGISGRRIAADSVDEVLPALADIWTNAHEQAARACELGWQDVGVVPASAGTCHSPLGDSPDTPVCALRKNHADEWHETSDGLLQWRDDTPDRLRLALAKQRERDTR